ncbi:hypothetical protein [Hyphomicrobium sp.]|uniref:hypothetical protein n=1 Tax=Hyphomicrobium sp. TaxID=82 RepID=UPI000FB0D925|nr:hypothetical protein [Hyphomicrobium sp.]RUO98572.1 MAG: hypothetical protein EKK30_10105 [Hyphomicrobium sp.]
MARDLREARLPITQADIDWLAGLLDLERQALVRATTEEERAEWDFYRVSARHPVTTWQNAEALWRNRLSKTDVSSLTGISRRKIANIVAGRTHEPVLTFPAAKQLADRLMLEMGPFRFLAGLPPHPR